MTNHTTPDTSAEILRLCEEKGVEPPEYESVWGEYPMFKGFHLVHMTNRDYEEEIIAGTEIPAFSVANLLMWSGWPEYLIRTVDYHDSKVYPGPASADGTPLGSQLPMWETVADSPAEALGLLLIEYLRTL